MNNPKIRYFSMFSGVGGFERGIQQAVINRLGRVAESSDTSDGLPQPLPDSSDRSWRRSDTVGSGSGPEDMQDGIFRDTETGGCRQTESLPEQGGRDASCEPDIRQYPIDTDPARQFSSGAVGEQVLDEQSQVQGLQSETDSTNPDSIDAQGTAVCVGYSEIDKHAIATYESHFKHTNYGDATKIDAEGLPDFDLLVGGSPCQSWSVAGKRQGFEDARGTLWYDVFRIIQAKRPKYILLENVKGILSHDNGESFKMILRAICDIGYIVDFTVLNSKNFGVPQNRERVFILGIRADLLDKKRII